jgi:hypothetical protein
MANPPILRGNRITADQFDELRRLYHTYWSDDNTELTFDDLLADQSEDNIDLHATGWGQQAVEPSIVAQHTEIKAEQTNRLINQINAGLYHIHSDTGFDLNSLTKYAQGSVIYYEAYRRITEVIDYIETQKLNIDPDKGSELVNDLDYSEGVTWTNEVSAKIKATFSSYQQARYFFNSGGKLVFDISAIDNTDTWTRILNNMGTITIGAINVVSSEGWIGTSTGGVYHGGGLGDPNIIYTYCDSGNGEYCYTSGAYESRRVYYEVEGNELPSGEFEVYVTIRLIDPSLDPIDLTIDMTAGYLLPIETPPPDILDSSLGDKFKTDPYVYQFIVRESPILSVDSSWT